MATDFEALKKEAAKAAVDLICNNMIVGIGSGSTVFYAIAELGARVANGLNIKAIPSSEQSRLLAKQHNIQITNFSEHPVIDLTFDGADQVEVSSLNLIKGLGNALLREKIVARNSKKLVIMVDERKLVDCLGNQTALPIEIIPFGWETTRALVSKYCPENKLKLNEDGTPLLTDNQNYILDCEIVKIADANELDKKLKLITGVVETGLFINMTSLVIVAKQSGISTLQKEKLPL